MPSPVSHTLEVPGARLYYEVQGRGPVLMLVGHPMGASGFAGIATVLAEDHTVVAFDPRGFGRSTIEDRDQDAEPDLLADDVRRVLDAVGHGPARIFGSSGGAVTGLALVARHPGHVHSLVAHEPPVALVLAGAAEARRGMQEIYDTYRNHGIGAAWQSFAAFTGMNMRPQGDQGAPPPGAPPSGPPPAPSAEAVATSDRFFRHGLLPITFYRPDFQALETAPVRVIVGGGATSKGQFAWRTANALAQRLGTPLVEFPGGHGGFSTDPIEFAAVLRRALA